MCQASKAECSDEERQEEMPAENVCVCGRRKTCHGVGSKVLHQVVLEVTWVRDMWDVLDLGFRQCRGKGNIHPPHQGTGPAALVPYSTHGHKEAARVPDIDAH